MSPHNMATQVNLLGGAVTTVRTLVRFFSRVCSDMFAQVIGKLKDLPTVIAHPTSTLALKGTQVIRRRLFANVLGPSPRQSEVIRQGQSLARASRQARLPHIKCYLVRVPFSDQPSPSTR